MKLKEKSKIVLGTILVLSLSISNIALAEINNNENKLESSTQSIVQNHYKKASELLNKRSFNLAIKELINAISTEPNNFEAFNKRGLAYFKYAKYKIDQKPNGIYEEDEFKEIIKYLNLSESDFNKSIELNNKNVEALNNKANVSIDFFQLLSKSFNSKIKQLEFYKSFAESMGVKSDSGGSDLKGVDEMVNKTKDSMEQLLSQAKDSLNKSIKLEPLNPDTFNIFALYYICKEDLKTAEENINKAIELDSKNPQFYNTLGMLNLIKQEYSLAEESFNNGLLIDSNNSELMRGLVLVYWFQNKYNLVFKCLNYLIKNDPQNEVNISMYNAFLRSYIDVDLEDALLVLKNQIEENPDNNDFKNILANTYMVLGNLLLFEKDSENAIIYFDASLSLNPDNKKVKTFRVMAYEQWANSYKNSKEYNKAIEIYEFLLEEDPNNEAVNVFLALTYKSKGDYNKAIEIYKKRVLKDPKFAPSHYELSTLYSLSKNKKLAIKELKEAIKLDKKFKSDAKNDKDFKNIKNDVIFKKLLK